MYISFEPDLSSIRHTIFKQFYSTQTTSASVPIRNINAEAVHTDSVNKVEVLIRDVVLRQRALGVAISGFTRGGGVGKVHYSIDG